MVASTPIGTGIVLPPVDHPRTAMRRYIVQPVATGTLGTEVRSAKRIPSPDTVVGDATSTILQVVIVLAAFVTLALMTASTTLLNL